MAIYTNESGTIKDLSSTKDLGGGYIINGIEYIDETPDNTVLTTNYSDPYIFNLPRDLGDYKFFITIPKIIKGWSESSVNQESMIVCFPIYDWYFDDDAKMSYDFTSYLYYKTLITIPLNNGNTYKWIRTNRTLPMYAHSSYGSHCGVKLFGIY